MHLTIYSSNIIENLLNSMCLQIYCFDLLFFYRNHHLIAKIQVPRPEQTRNNLIGKQIKFPLLSNGKPEELISTLTKKIPKNSNFQNAKSRKELRSTEGNGMDLIEHNLG